MPDTNEAQTDLPRAKDLPDYSKEHQCTLFEQISSMLDNSLIVYSIVHQRHMVKRGKLKDPDHYLETPLKLSDALNMIDKNTNATKDDLGKSGSVYMEVIEDMRKRTEARLKEQGTTLAEMDAGDDCHGLVVIGDSNPKEELVYSISVDHVRKIISVQFRGTVTSEDMKTDLHMYTWEVVSNPLKDKDGQPKEIRLHRGFCNYLYGPESQKMQAGTKFNTIKNQTLEYLDKFPGYQIYVTGHSLGGALSTLFAFSMAAQDDPRITVPVMCISIASPKVGNSEFCEAFEYLEDHDKLRHLRVINKGDVVPMVPERDFVTCYANMAFNPKGNFYHTGIEVELNSLGHGIDVSYKDRTTLGYAGGRAKTLGYKTMLVGALPAGYYDVTKHHGLHTYLNRINANEDNLKKLSAEDLYKMRKEGKRGVYVKEKKSSNKVQKKGKKVKEEQCDEKE